MPTIAEACGIHLRPESFSPPLDGVSLWKTLIRKCDIKTPPRKDLLLWSGWATPQAIRLGTWKFFFDNCDEVLGSNTGAALFNLADDIEDLHHIASKNPEFIEKILAIARACVHSIDTHSIPLGGHGIDQSPQPTPAAWLQPRKVSPSYSQIQSMLNRQNHRLDESFS